MPENLDLELGAAAYKVVRDITDVKQGESVLITIDSAGSWKVAEELAKAAEALGAKVMVGYHSTPVGVGKVAEPHLPDSLKAAIPATDVWLELNAQWLGYSSTYEEALVPPNRTRYLCLCGLNVERMVRFFGSVDLKLLDEFQRKVVELTKQAKEMHITTPGGTDVRFENDPRRPVLNEMWCHTPGAHFPLGQIAWAPIEETINGEIVFDGSFYAGGPADLPALSEPITFHVRNGKCVEISGGEEAKIARQWIESLQDPGMYHEAHICYGFHPAAKLSGICVEDERVWSVTQWGFGHQGVQFNANGVSAVSHLDGICLNSSVWQDEEQILDEGEVVHSELIDLARRLGK
jgi:leucyl aminopeptidase (aminopeptidase T)